jgi:hypothetical protein
MRWAVARPDVIRTYGVARREATWPGILRGDPQGRSVRGVERELVMVEELVWKNDAKLYYDRLTDQALLVFPETTRATASPTSA